MPGAHLIAAAALTGSLLGGGVARAEAPWSAPLSIASGVESYTRPALAFTGDGHAQATLRGDSAGDLSRILVAAPGTSAFTETGRSALVAPPAVYGRRAVAYLRTRPVAGAKTTRLGASLGATSGALGRFQPLARVALPVGEARIAADARGNIAAGWLEPRGRQIILRVALRRPGQPFGRPTTLVGDVEVREWELAYGADGDLVVAFERSLPPDFVRRELAVRVKRSGRRFGPIQSLGRLHGSVGPTSIATAVAPTGRAVVAWGTQLAGEEADSPWTVHAALLSPGAGRFSRPQVLDPGQVTAPPDGPVRAAIGRDGTATVTWSGIVRAKVALSYPVRVATARRARRFGAAQQLAPSGAAIGVVTAADGTTTVLWGSVSDPDSEVLDAILASRRRAGTSIYAAPEAVTERETAADAAIALDPQSDRPATLWIGAPGGVPGQSLMDLPVEPRYSIRSG
jgi:hypothetical protein